jgi:hypothetical protein
MGKRKKTKKIPVNKIRAVQRREQLSPAQEKQVKAIHEQIGEHLLGVYETFEFTFCCDTHPEQEIFIWAHIAKVLDKWRQQNPYYTPDQEKDAYAQFLSISMGVDAKQEWKNLYFDS